MKKLLKESLSGIWGIDPKGRKMFSPSQKDVDSVGTYSSFVELFNKDNPNVILNMPYNQLQPNTGFKNNSVDDIIKLRKGLTLGFVKNGHWSLVDKLEGPSHEYGGIPLNIDTDGIAFMNNGEFIKAEKGLVIGGEPKRYTYGISKTGTREESNQFKFGERDDVEHFYKTYYGPVSEALRNTGKPIPIDAILAQAYIESTGGRNTLVNNFSGQKAYGSKYEDAATREKDNLKYGIYKTFEYFDTDKKYPTMEFDGKTIIDTVKYKPRKPGEYRQIHSIEPATGSNEGKYKYVLDDYFVEADDATKGFENYINNFYETDRKEYKKAITDEKILADPYKFVETIAPAYSTSSDYANTTKKYVGMMQPHTIKKKETEQKRIDYIENKQNKQKAQDSLPFKDWVDIEVGRSGKTAGEVMGKMSGKAANGMVMNKGGVEAEGGELIIKNNFGDYAIIPKKSSGYVSGLLKGNNMRGIDEFVSGLPTAKNYAEEGLIIGGDDPPFGPIFVDSKNDPRYQAYQDSLYMHNLGKNDYITNFVKPQVDYELKQYNEFITRFPEDKNKLHKPTLNDYPYSKKNISSYKPTYIIPEIQNIINTGNKKNILSSGYFSKEGVVSGVYYKPPEQLVFINNSTEADNAKKQIMLKELGLYTGEIDGDWGPLSKDAWTKYETMQQQKLINEVKIEQPIQQPAQQQQSTYQPKTNKYRVIKKEGYGFYDDADKKEIRNYSAPGQNERKFPYYEIRFDDGTIETLSYENFMKYYKKAEKGLVIGGDLSKLGSKVKPSKDTNTYNASTSTIKPINPNVNTSLIGKTWDDIPTNSPNYNQPQLKQDTRTDYEREQDQKAMEDYQNPNFIEQLWSGARMVPRAIADPIQGVGQIFDAVGLGDTRIGKDLGNFNDEEAAYRYRNVNPNMSAGEKFMGNLGEGSEVAALGAINFIPFEGSVINPIVKGLVGKGNYSSYIANQLYSPLVNQGVKQVDDVTENIIKTVDDDNAKYIAELRKELSENGIVQSQKTPNLPWKEPIRKGIEPWGYGDSKLSPLGITNSKTGDVKAAIFGGKNKQYIDETDFLKSTGMYPLKLRKSNELLIAKGEKPIYTEDLQKLLDDRPFVTKYKNLKSAINERDAIKFTDKTVDLGQKNRYATWDMYLGKPQTKHPLYDISELTTSKKDVIYTIKEDFMNKAAIEGRFNTILKNIDDKNINIIPDTDTGLFGTMGGFHWEVNKLSDGNYKIFANDLWDLQPLKGNKKLPNLIKDIEVGKALGIGKPLNVQVGFIYDPKAKKIINTFGIAGIGTAGTIGVSQENNNNTNSQ